MKKLILSVLLTAPLAVFSQFNQIDLPITWDDSNVDYTVSPFGGPTTQIVANPNNSSDNVLEITKVNGAQTWGGVTLGNTSIANPVPFTSSDTKIMAKVWSPAAGKAFLLKVESDTNAAFFVETTDTSTVANGWEWLEFDFSNPHPNGQQINLSWSYDRVSFFPDFGASGAGDVFLLDSIKFVTGTPPPAINSPYCQTQVFHFGNTAEAASAINLTVENDGMNGFKFTIESTTSDPVDDLIIAGGSGGTPSALDNSVPGQLSRTLTWTSAPPSDVIFNVLWSKLTMPGNWQLVPGAGQDTVSFNATCFGAPASKMVTFQVDMNQYGSSFTIPEVNGDFNGWCGNCNAMADPDMDGIWEVTVDLAGFDSIEYKFAHDAWTGEESLMQGMPCTKTTNGFTNRFMYITGDTVLPAVCWESCSTCGTPPSTFNVTFQVDMNQYTGSFTTPEVNGIFNGWCGNCNPMSDADMDGIWEVTLPITADSTEYKFSFDNWAGQENLTPGDPCTKTDGGFTNRFVVLTADTVLPAVCWESCATCTTPPTMVDITFQVDMTQYSGISYSQVNLNGTFNGWCGDCAEMLDSDNDSIYEITVSLPEMDTIEYKFTVDGWDDEEQFAGGEPCTKTNGGFTNRYYVPTADATLDAVCWGSCDACETVGVSVNEIDFASSMSIAPNPAKELVTLRGMNINNEITTIEVLDIQGKVVYTAIENQSAINHNINVANFVPGMYFVQVSAQSGRWTEKLIINE